MSSRLGETATSLRMSAPISPPASATPAPIIAMNVTATTPKPAKLGTNDVKMNRMPSDGQQALDRDRLTVLIVELVAVACRRRRARRSGWVVSS